MKLRNRMIQCVEHRLFGVGTSALDASNHPWFNTKADALAHPVPSHIETPWHIYSIDVLLELDTMKEEA